MLASSFQNLAGFDETDARQGGQIVTARQNAHVAELLKAVETVLYGKNLIQLRFLNKDAIAKEIHFKYNLEEKSENIIAPNFHQN